MTGMFSQAFEHTIPSFWGLCEDFFPLVVFVGIPYAFVIWEHLFLFDSENILVIVSFNVAAYVAG